MQKIELKNKHDEKIVGLFYKADKAGSKKMAIVCHGFAASKDMGFLPDLCSGLQVQGINAFSFDFSGNGESEGKFTESLRKKQLEEIKLIVDYWHPKGFDIGLIGHSRGAMHSVIYAPKDKRIKFVISISARANPEESFSNVFPEQILKLEKGEIFYWHEKKTGRRWPITKEIVEDLRNFDMFSAVKEIHVPILFLHGKKDRACDYHGSEELFAAANEPKEIKLYERSTHVFMIPEERKKMIEDCTAWVKALKP